MKSANTGFLLGAMLLTFGAWAGTYPKGQVTQTVTSTGKAVLDPNTDNFVSSTNSGFSSNDQTESEIPYIPLPQVVREPSGDIRTGAVGGVTDLVDTATNQSSFVYYSKGVDGTADTADDKLLFRLRIGKQPSGAFGYSFLIDTDRKFGTSGPNADPNAVTGNPGFEIELIVATGGSSKGVNIYDVNGRTAGVLKTSYAFTERVQYSLALTENDGDDDVFLDTYINFADLNTYFSVTSSTALRFVTSSSSSPSSSLGGSASDVAGIPDNDLAYADRDAAFTAATSNAPVTSFSGLSSGGGFDTTAPDTSILTGPTGLTTSNSASFTFSATEVGSTFECKLDGGSYASCTSGVSFSALADGAHTFYVRAIDSALNVDATPATRAWTVDATAPAAPVIATPTEGSTGGASPSIGGTAEASSTVKVYLNAALSGQTTADSGGNWVYVPSSPLADGPYAATATSTDSAGNTGTVSNTRNFSVDSSLIDTAIDSTPSSNSNSASAAFVFSSNTGSVEFQCQLDGTGGFTLCATTASPSVNFNSLAEGSHTLEVRARDTNTSATDATPASYTWTVDLTPPDTSLSTAVGTLTQSASASFSFSATGGATSFQCSLDGAGFATCTSPQSYSAVADGPHTFAVRAVDPAGNVDPSPASHAWTIDSSGPAAPVLTRPTSGQVVSTNPPPFEGTAEPGSTVSIFIDGSLIGTALADGSGVWSFTPVSTLAQNLTFNVTLQAKDAAGNDGAVSAPVPFSIDAMAPNTLLTSGPPSLSNQAGATFTFTSDDGSATFECAVAGGAYASCSSPLALTGLGDGDYQLVVRAKDTVGNVDPSPALYAWTIDTTPPAAPAQTLVLAGDVVGTLRPVLGGFSEPGSIVSILVDNTIIGTAQADADGHWSYMPGADLAVGGHNLSFFATDAAGNVGPSSAQLPLTIDPTAIDTFLQSTPASVSTSSIANFSFAASVGGAHFECQLDGGTLQPCSSPSSFTGLTDGEHTLRIYAIGPDGDRDKTPAGYTWTVDTTPPVAPIISYPSSGTVVGFTQPTVSGTGEPGSIVTVLVDGAVVGTAPVDARGQWSLMLGSPLSPGAHAISAVATDPGGLASAPASVSVTVNTSTLDTAIVYAPPTLSYSATATFDFVSNQSGVSFLCALDGAPATACSQPVSYAGLADGDHTLSVTAVDGLATPDSSPALYRWTVDLLAPAIPTVSVPAQAALLRSPAPLFSGLSEPGALVVVTVDGTEIGRAVAGVNGKWFLTSTTILAEGSHQITTRAEDGAGRASGNSTSTLFTVDTVPPETTVASGPAASTESGAAGFELTASEPGSTFECKLDAASWQSCTSSASFDGLALGAHTLLTRATDLAGNTDRSPSRYLWQVVAPGGQPSAPPAPSATVASESFQGGGFGCSAGAGGSSSRFLGLLTLAGLFAWRRRRGRGPVWSALALPLLLPLEARAQVLPDFQLERLDLSPTALESIAVTGGSMLQQGGFRLGLGVRYDRDPLIYFRDGREVGSVIRYRVSTQLAGAVALTDRLELGGNLPIVARQGGDDLTAFGVAKPTAAGVGSPRLYARYGLLSRARGNPVWLAVQLGVQVPLGSDGALAQDHGWGVVPKVGLTRELGWFVAAAEVGALLRRRFTVGSGDSSARLGSQLALGASVSTRGPGPRLELDLRSSIPLTGARSAAELLAGGRLPLWNFLELFALAGPGIGNAPGVPKYRVLAGLALAKWAPEAPVKREVPVPQPIAAVAPAPAPDSATESEPEPAPEAESTCSEDGCPDGETETLPIRELLLQQRIYFEKSRPTLDPRSFAYLNEVAEALQRHPELTRILIQGHTDDRGPAAMNLKLSIARAESVRSYLVMRGGVDAGRLQASGMGETKPQSTNDTELGREANRRVEFVILETPK